MDAIDEIYTKRPIYGKRKMKPVLDRDYGIVIGLDHVRRLMRLMGIEAIYPKPNLSKACPLSKKYPYLLKNLIITSPNQVWATDITYIKLTSGWCYLIAILDWHSRYVLSWRLSKNLELPFCLEALNEALEVFGIPEYFNTDQGSHFTATEWIAILKEKNIKISMDGRGRCWDNIFTERLWRNVKYEDVFIKGYADFSEANIGLAEYFIFYNTERPHQSLGYRTPAEIYDFPARSAQRTTLAEELKNGYDTVMMLPEAAEENVGIAPEKQQLLFIDPTNPFVQKNKPMLAPYAP